MKHYYFWKIIRAKHHHALPKMPNSVRKTQVCFVGHVKWHLPLLTMGMKRADLAKKLGISPQYVSRLLSGTENLSFKSIANIEEKLGVNCLNAALS